jgi:hypothetical protein
MVYHPPESVIQIGSGFFLYNNAIHIDQLQLNSLLQMTDP